MRHTSFALSLLTVLLVPFCVPVSAQTEAEDDPINCGDLVALVEVNREIVELMKAEKEQKAEEIELKKLELAVSYLQFRAREIEALESFLIQANEYRDAFDDNLTRSFKVADQMEREAREASGPEAEELREMVAKLREGIERNKDRQARAQAKVFDLQNRIDEGRRNLEYLEEFIDENLDLGN